MLSKIHFYHRITRKMVVAFGTLFNNMKLYRYNKAGTQEIERITVPLAYAGKEKFYNRITGDPDLGKEIRLTLPRMSFEMTAITYDPLRKTSMFNDTFSYSSGSTVLRAQRTPYNFDFNLYIYVRNVEDGTQIVEQILPYFSPDYTLTADLLGDGNLTDIPMILQSISNDTTDDTGEEDNLRTIVWTLSFTVKGFMIGPSTESKIIREAVANTFNSTFNFTGTKRITVANGNSRLFKVGELVYEGNTINSANATAFVKSWDPVSKTLIIDTARGTFFTNRPITGAVSNASYMMSGFDEYDNQLINFTVEPDPYNAAVNSAFGFIETTEYYPNIT